MDKTFRILGNISAIIGIIVFLYPLLDIKDLIFTVWQKIFIVISILILMHYIVYEILSGPKKYTNETDIKKYMREWIGRSGRVVIFTRDMSWTDDRETKDKLRNKAQNKELIICQPKITSFTQELKILGAEIYEYDKINFTPKTRFTFVNYNTAFSKVAIGRRDKDNNHFIEEISIGDNNMQYFLAEDLVNIIKALQ